MQSATVKNKIEAVFEACKKALKKLDISIEVIDKEKWTITGSTPTSFLSWGENIQINLEKINQYSIRLDVESTSKAQLISWGKNDENERDIIHEVEQILSKK